MKQFYLFLFIIFIFNACAINYESIDIEKKEPINKNIIELSSEVSKLSTKIDKNEAMTFSNDVISYSKILANEYGVTTPPLFHNTLINLNLKEKGYCYHYANDLMGHLQEKKFKSFYFQRIVANRGEYFEHSSLILTRDDISFEDSIVLDAWRNAGILFWSKVKDDKKYNWEKK